MIKKDSFLGNCIDIGCGLARVAIAAKIIGTASINAD
jgi:predicted RNA methylase